MQRTSPEPGDRKRVDRSRRLLSLLQSVKNDDDDCGVCISPTSDGSGSVGVYATRSLPTGHAIGCSSDEGGLPVSAILDPVEVLDRHPLARAAREIGGASEKLAFWLALSSMATEAVARVDGARTGIVDGIVDFSRHDDYLASLPEVAPDPCSWSAEERGSLLGGTPLALQADRMLKTLREEYDAVATKMRKSDDSPSSLPSLPPFDVCGRGIGGSVLWARGVYQSRSFPRSLLNAAMAEESSAGRPILKVKLGGWHAPRISYTGPQEATCDATEAAKQNDDDPKNEVTEISGRVANSSMDLGVMLPFYDLLEHKCGHPIEWEAEGGRVRFRTAVSVEAGGQIYNNYGPKGNAELLYTYGFAVRDNPLDSVDGIVVGCPGIRERESTASDVALYEARVALLREHGIPHKLLKGSLLLGPFSLHRELPRENDGGAHEIAPKEGVVSADLLFALSIIGMESVEEGPGISLDEIEMLQNELKRRLDTLEFSEDANNSLEEHSRDGFAAAYKEGQRSLLRAALTELDALCGGGDDPAPE